MCSTFIFPLYKGLDMLEFCSFKECKLRELYFFSLLAAKPLPLDLLTDSITKHSFIHSDLLQFGGNSF